jgi:hypothetical protein
MISARLSIQGVRRSVWGPETFSQGGDTSHGARRLEGAARCFDMYKGARGPSDQILIRVGSMDVGFHFSFSKFGKFVVS